VTLAQEHVLSLLLKKFRNQDWGITIFRVPLPDTSSAPGAPSPVSSLHPYLVVATHQGVPPAPSGVPPTSSGIPLAAQVAPPQVPAVQLAFDTAVPTLGADPCQLADLLKVVDRENRSRSALRQLAGEPTAGNASSHSTSSSDPTRRGTVTEHSDALPAFSDSDTEALRELEPGRRMVRRLGSALGQGEGLSQGQEESEGESVSESQNLKSGKQEQGGAGAEVRGHCFGCEARWWTPVGACPAQCS